MKQAIEKALLTWYPKDHPLHFYPHHPLGKLLGEWGELLDDYMKGLYKPGYVFNPEDELGDIWYYIRILAYQSQYEPKYNLFFADKQMDTVIAFVILDAAKIFLVLSSSQSSKHNCFFDNELAIQTLDWAYSALLEIAKRCNLTLDQLTASNWEKLKPGSTRGDEWEKARELYHSKH